MRNIRTACWAIINLVYWTSGVHGAPIVAALGAVGAWIAQAGFVGQIIANVALAAITFGLEYLLSGGGARVDAASSDVQEGSITPQRDGLLTVCRGYGTATTPGAVFFQQTATDAGKTATNVYLLGLVLSQGECDSLVSVIINGTECSLDATGKATTAPWFDGSNSYFSASFRGGTDTQTIDPLIASYFLTPPDDFYPDLDHTTRTTNWANFRQRGLCTIVIAMAYGTSADHHVQLWGAGGIPQIIVRFKGLKVYDRTDASQDPNDKTTWKWSDIATICIEDYLCSDIGGQADHSEIDDAAAKESIEIDREWIPLLDGTLEQRGRVNGIIYSNEVNADVIASMEQQNRGIVSKQFSQYVIRSDRPAEAVMTIHKGLLFNEGSLNYRNEPDTRSMTTGVVTQFYPAQRFGQNSQVSYPASAIDDKASQQITLKYCDSSGAAQRLSFAIYTESNIGRTIAGDFLPGILVAPGKDAGLLAIGDVAWFDFPAPYDTINGFYQINSISISSNFVVTVSMSGTTPDIINGWSTALEVPLAEVA